MKNAIQPLLDFLHKNLGYSNGTQVESTHRQQLRALYALGISHEDALEFVFEQRPDAARFMQWIETRKRVFPAIPDCPDVLSEADLAFWKKNGYVVVREAVHLDACAAARQAIWDYLGASSEHSESWYGDFEGSRGLMLRFCDDPALDAIRNSPRIRKAYAQLYGHTKIFKTIDKTSFNPPDLNGHTFRGSQLHWDVSLHLPIADEFQGLLYLNATGDKDGAFHCVPEFHRGIDAWLKDVPEDLDPRGFALEHLEPVPVAGHAGDFVIWHQALPHCATPNYGKHPRMVFYMTYLPEGSEEPTVWK